MKSDTLLRQAGFEPANDSWPITTIHHNRKSVTASFEVRKPSHNRIIEYDGVTITLNRLISTVDASY
jgi:hypothetical protein